MNVWDGDLLEQMPGYGEYLRKKRKEKGLRIGDMTDRQISSATISHIETGKKRVGIEKIRHYCEKLDIEVDDLPRYLQKEQEKKKQTAEETMLMLQMVETTFHCLGVQEGWRMLRKIELPESDFFAMHNHFLRGKCLSAKGKWEKAFDQFQYALNLIKRNPKFLQTNIAASICHEVASLYHQQNQVHKALEWTDRGLSFFQEKGSRGEALYLLLLLKASYLEQLTRVEEASAILENVFTFHSRTNSDILLRAYALKATIYNRQNQFQDAIDLIHKAIVIARSEDKPDRCFELLTIQASSYRNLGKWPLAQICFDTAAKFEARIGSPRLIAIYHKELGILSLVNEKRQTGIDHLLVALKLGEQLNDVFCQYESLHALGEASSQQGATEEAIQYLTRAHQIVVANGYKWQEKEIVFNLAKCYEDLGEEKQHQKYLARYYQVSVELMNKGE